MTKRGGVTEEKQQLDFMKFLLLHVTIYRLLFHCEYSFSSFHICINIIFLQWLFLLSLLVYCVYLAWVWRLKYIRNNISVNCFESEMIAVVLHDKTDLFLLFLSFTLCLWPSFTFMLLMIDGLLCEYLMWNIGSLTCRLWRLFRLCLYMSVWFFNVEIHNCRWKLVDASVKY